MTTKGLTITKDFEIADVQHTLFTRIDVEGDDAHALRIRQWIEGPHGKGPNAAEHVYLDSDALDDLYATLRGLYEVGG